MQKELMWLQKYLTQHWDCNISSNDESHGLAEIVSVSYYSLKMYKSIIILYVDLVSR